MSLASPQLEWCATIRDPRPVVKNNGHIQPRSGVQSRGETLMGLLRPQLDLSCATIKDPLFLISWSKNN